MAEAFRHLHVVLLDRSCNDVYTGHIYTGDIVDDITYFQTEHVATNMSYENMSNRKSPR